MPRSYVFDAFGTESLGPVSVGASAVNTSVQSVLTIPCACKITKVGISFTATDNVATNAINVVYNTVQPPTTGGAYLANGVVPNDNSDTAGIAVGTSVLVTGAPNPQNAVLTPANQQGGLGVPTNYAVNNQPLFAADIILNTTNFPGATVGGGGSNIFIPTNYDAVYPAGPALSSTGYINQFGFFTLRAISTTSIANLVVTLFYIPITMRAKWGPPSSNDSVVTPGLDY